MWGKATKYPGITVREPPSKKEGNCLDADCWMAAWGVDGLC